jgi:hypothetical protein
MMKIEVVKRRDGKPHWRLRDASGQIVPLNPGKVFLPRSTPAENRRVRDAVDWVLTRRAAETPHLVED